MTSIQGNKKIHCLGQDVDIIITPNEYTLDMIASPLFSVHILNSQISANNVSAGRFQHENSHMIHIMSLGNSIWRVEVW